MKAAYQFLGVSSRRLSNYLNDNKSLYTNGQVSNIKGYTISRLASFKGDCKMIKVTNIQTNEVINYSSISLASKSLGILQSSISLYLRKKRTTPFRGIYLIELVSVT
jgi:hypothetical protein